jgi:hypothetical protein
MVLDIKAPAPAAVIRAILDLHHVQRLLADEERRGLRFDEKLIAAQKALRRRLIAIYELQYHVIWPTDTVAGHLCKRNGPAHGNIEDITRP